MRKKIVLSFLVFIMSFFFIACQDQEKTEEVTIDNTYLLMMEAEDLSGMSEKTKIVITLDGSLNLPTVYKGVTITYSSRNKEIISDEGVVQRPSTCWIESRDQQGIAKSDLVGLNDNWPIVIDVTMSYNGQQRTAKLLFVVAPRDGFTCQKYLG